MLFDLCPAHFKEITDALKAGKKISAIKAFKECTGKDLKTSKAAIDFALDVFDAMCPEKTIVIDSEGNQLLADRNSEAQFPIISLFTESDIISMLDTDNMIDLAYRAMSTEAQKTLIDIINEEMIDQFRFALFENLKRIIIDSIKELS